MTFWARFEYRSFLSLKNKKSNCTVKCPENVTNCVDKTNHIQMKSTEYMRYGFNISYHLDYFLTTRYWTHLVWRRALVWWGVVRCVEVNILVLCDVITWFFMKLQIYYSEEILHSIGGIINLHRVNWRKTIELREKIINEVFWSN